jgi:DDE superfamily endonuclease
MTRTHGRAPVGERVYGSAPGRWESITLTCGLRLCGVTAALAFPGATNTDVFEAYVEQVLVPELKPGDVVIWDNLKPPQSEEATEAIEAAGARSGAAAAVESGPDTDRGDGLEGQGSDEDGGGPDDGGGPCGVRCGLA